MSETAIEPPAAGESPAVKRHFRNYLVDTGLQLRLAFYAAAAALALAGAVGWLYLEAQSEASRVAALGDPALDDGVRAALRAADRREAVTVAVGLLLAAVALVIVGVRVTHKVAGPAYVMAKVLDDVAEGRLPAARALRRGDLLQELGRSCGAALDHLRERERDEARRLRAVAAALPPGGAREEIESLAAAKEARLGETA